jgi:biopolymer transport protein ExbB/TolQ
MTTGLAVAALVVAVLVALVSIVSLARARARLAAVERRLFALDGELHDDVRRAIEQTRDEARAAGREARRAARAAGVPEDPPRMPFEPVAARLVRVAAFGAGVRRAARRLARDDAGRAPTTGPIGRRTARPNGRVLPGRR